MDEVNKNIALNTPCPVFFQEEKEVVKNITCKETECIETMVNLSNETIVTTVNEEESDSGSSSENENKSTTIPSPIPIALPIPIIPLLATAPPPPPPPTITTVELPSIPSPLNTVSQYNNPFPTQQLNNIFSPNFPSQPPQVGVDQMFDVYDHQPPISLMKFIANKNDSYTKSHGGKNVNFMRQLYEKEEMKIDTAHDDDDDKEEEEVKSELRQTTKNNRQFHRTLFLKKKECVIKSFPILSQKNADLVVCAENKFKEIARIYTLKKIYREKCRYKEYYFRFRINGT